MSRIRRVRQSWQRHLRAQLKRLVHWKQSVVSQEGDTLLCCSTANKESPKIIRNTSIHQQPLSPPPPSSFPSQLLHPSTYFPPPALSPPCPCACPPPVPLPLPPAPLPATAFAFLSPALCALAAKPPLLISLPPVACCVRVWSARRLKLGHMLAKGCFEDWGVRGQRTCVDWMRWASDLEVWFEDMVFGFCLGAWGGI